MDCFVPIYSSPLLRWTLFLEGTCPWRKGEISHTTIVWSCLICYQRSIPFSWIQHGRLLKNISSINLNLFSEVQTKLFSSYFSLSTWRRILTSMCNHFSSNLNFRHRVLAVIYVQEARDCIILNLWCGEITSLFAGIHL